MYSERQQVCDAGWQLSTARANASRKRFISMYIAVCINVYIVQSANDVWFNLVFRYHVYQEIWASPLPSALLEL